MAVRRMSRRSRIKRVNVHIYEVVYNDIAAAAANAGCSVGYMLNEILQEAGFGLRPAAAPSERPAPLMPPARPLDPDMEAAIEELYGPPDTPDTSDT